METRTTKEYKRRRKKERKGKLTSPQLLSSSSSNPLRFQRSKKQNVHLDIYSSFPTTRNIKEIERKRKRGGSVGFLKAAKSLLSSDPREFSLPKWKGKNGLLSPLAGDAVHSRPHPILVSRNSKVIWRDREGKLSPLVVRIGQSDWPERLERSRAIFSRRDQLVRHINDHGAPDYPSRLPAALPSLLAGANFLGKLIALPRIFSLSLSAFSLPSSKKEKRESRRGRRNDDVVVVDKREFLPSSATIEANYFLRDEYL